MPIPHWAPPTHAMQIFSYAETGSIGLLWISATNPAVSMPESAGVGGSSTATSASSSCRTCSSPRPPSSRRACSRRRGVGREDRHVHQRRPHRPPLGRGRRSARGGAQRPRHLAHVRRRDGVHQPGRRPLMAWRTPEEAFDAWASITAGRPVDYTGLSYDKLRLTIHPVARERAAPRRHRPPLCRRRLSHGHRLLRDLRRRPHHRRHRHRDRAQGDAARRAGLPQGSAVHACHQEPSADYPLRYTTGCTVYHFHTRTKTGRSGDLNRAAPDAWVEISPPDADARDIAEGDWVRVESPRGALRSVPGWVTSWRARCSLHSTTATGSRTPTSAEGTKMPCTGSPTS